MSVTRRFVIAALSMLCLHGIVSAEPSNSPPPPGSPAAIIRLSGEVDDFRRDLLIRQFHQAVDAGAKTVIVEIDTYGGLVTSGLDISRFLRGQNIHTIAFINNKAISAGSMIALACNEIWMAPGSSLGDCAPIIFDQAGRLEPLPPAERAKQESPILADFRESAKRNGYDPLVATAMVSVDLSVYYVQDATGKEKKFVGEAEYKTLKTAGWKDVPGVTNPIDGPETLLTVGTEVAQRLGLSKGIAKSAQELASQRGYTIVADLTPGFGDSLVELINSHGARFLLIVIFLLSLYIAIHAPGHGAAEAVAILSLGLLVCVPMLTGYAQWWELAMIFIGLALCAFEVLVFPGHGVSLILGVIMILVGLLLTFAGRELNPGWFPHSVETWHRLKDGGVIMVWALVVAVVAGALLRPFLPKLPIFRRLILTETSGKPVVAAGPALKAGEDVWPFVGTIGLAKTDLRPGGVVQFPYGAAQRNADVVSVSGYIVAGAKVVVQEARGNRITVRDAWKSKFEI